MHGWLPAAPAVPTALPPRMPHILPAVNPAQTFSQAGFWLSPAVFALERGAEDAEEHPASGALLDETFMPSLLPKPRFFTLKHPGRGGQQSDSPVPMLPWRWGSHTCRHTHAGLHPCTHAHMHAHPRAHPCTHVHIHACTPTCTYTPTCIHMHTCAYTSVHTCSHPCTPTCTPMHTRTAPFITAVSCSRSLQAAGRAVLLGAV